LNILVLLFNWKFLYNEISFHRQMPVSYVKI